MLLFMILGGFDFYVILYVLSFILCEGIIGM